MNKDITEVDHMRLDGKLQTISSSTALSSTLRSSNLLFGASGSGEPECRGEVSSEQSASPMKVDKSDMVSSDTPSSTKSSKGLSSLS